MIDLLNYYVTFIGKAIHLISTKQSRLYWIKINSALIILVTRRNASATENVIKTSEPCFKTILCNLYLCIISLKLCFGPMLCVFGLVHLQTGCLLYCVTFDCVCAFSIICINDPGFCDFKCGYFIWKCNSFKEMLKAIGFLGILV